MPACRHTVGSCAALVHAQRGPAHALGGPHCVPTRRSDAVCGGRYWTRTCSAQKTSGCRVSKRGVSKVLGGRRGLPGYRKDVSPLKLRSRSVLACSVLLLAPVLSTPQALADPSVPLPPVHVQVGGLPSVPSVEPPKADDVVAINAVQLDPPPDDAAVDPVPDPNAPQPVPYVSIESGASAETATNTDTHCHYYQTARWLKPEDGKCPPLHWATGQWYVEDHTDNRWPVRAAVAAWNAGSIGMHIGYGCLPSKYHCVKIVQGRYGATKWAGQAPYSYTANDHAFHAVSIQMNDSYSLTADQHMQAIVHELGHAAGLGHEMTNVGPMWYQATGEHTSPNSAEFGQLSYHTYNNVN